MKTRKNIKSMCQNITFNRYVLLIREEKYMEENIFVITVCRSLVQSKYYKLMITDCFNVNGTQMIKMPKKGEYVRSKNYERKITIYDLCRF